MVMFVHELKFTRWSPSRNKFPPARTTVILIPLYFEENERMRKGYVCSFNSPEAVPTSRCLGRLGGGQSQQATL